MVVAELGGKSLMDYDIFVLHLKPARKNMHRYISAVNMKNSMHNYHEVGTLIAKMYI